VTLERLRLKWIELRFLTYFLISIQVRWVWFTWLRLRGQGDRVPELVYQASVGWSHQVFSLLGCRVEVTGAEHIPAQGPMVVMSNHQSRFDIPLLSGYFGRPLGFAAKRELYRLPGLSYWMKELGCIPIDRKRAEDSGRAFEAGGERLVREKRWIIIFPEGTRSRDPQGEIQAFKRGSLRLAESQGIPVIPVSLDGTRLLDDPRAVVATPPGERVIRIKVGAPVAVPKGLSAPQRRDLVESLRDTIVSNRESIRVHWRYLD